MTIRSLATNALTEIRRQRWSVRPPRPGGRTAVRVNGPKWFATLIADEFDIAPTSDLDAPLIRWDHRTVDAPPGTLSNPFLSPRRSYPGSRRNLPRGCPKEFHRLDAVGRFRRPPEDSGGDVVDGDDTSDQAKHVALRLARQSSLLHELGSAVEGSTSAPDVDVVCVSRRPERAVEVLALFDAQTYAPKRLTIVATVPIDEDSAINHVREGRPDVTIVERAGTTLGGCLNEFIDNTAAPLVAKWDDDDWYGPNYLLDLVFDRNATGAAVTGKHSYFAYLEQVDSTHLRFPGQEFRDTSFLAGGSLLLDIDALAGIRFPNLNLGEDRGLLASCTCSGLRVRSSDPFNYVQRRGADNTWKVADAEFLARSSRVGSGLRLDRTNV